MKADLPKQESGSMADKRRKTNDTLLGPFRELALEQQRLARQAEMLYAPEVDAVIRDQSRDTKRIERLLDGILDFCFDIGMLRLYKKLCRHYFQIDPQATAFYINAYRDMWDDQDKEDSKESGCGTGSRI
ncbi:MAG: hypothetical protein V2A78_02935 [bacterium]